MNETWDESKNEGWTEAKIKSLTFFQALELRRFAPAGHPLFRHDCPLSEVFDVHYKNLLTTTPIEDRITASKRLGLT